MTAQIYLSEMPSTAMAAAAVKLRTAFPADAVKRATADLLDEIARQYDAPPCDDPRGVCNGCERREDFNDALRLSLAVLGLPR